MAKDEAIQRAEFVRLVKWFLALKLNKAGIHSPVIRLARKERAGRQIENDAAFRAWQEPNTDTGSTDG